MIDDPPAGRCEVCNEESIWVTFPMPHTSLVVGYGINCIVSNAHPYAEILRNAAIMGGYDRTPTHWRGMIDGTLRRLNVNLDKFKFDVQAEIKRRLAETARGAVV